MSTILKALEKVEEDERVGRTPRAEESPEPRPGGLPAEPAGAQSAVRLPWRGALIGAGVVAFTLGLVWLWTPGQTGQEIAQEAPAKPSTVGRGAEGGTEAGSASRGSSGELPAAVASGTPEEAVVPIPSSPPPRVAESAPPPASEPAVPQAPLPVLTQAAQPAPPPSTEQAPLAVAAAVQPTAEDPGAVQPALSPPAAVASPQPGSPLPAAAAVADASTPAASLAPPAVASQPVISPAPDPPPVRVDPPAVERGPSASVASAPPPARAPPAPKPMPPAVVEADPPAPARPKPARVASIPAAPSVHVSGTVWHPSPDRRSARVRVEGFAEPLELKEGDAVGVLVVAEIQPSAVVFLHGGSRLRRSVGK